MPAILLRTSERTTFTRCRQKWHWAYNLGLTPHVNAPALRFGDLAHQALAAFYKPGLKRGPHPAKTFTKLYKKELELATKYGVRDEDETWQEAGELGVAMMEGYVKLYGNDPDIEVIAPEHPFKWKVKVTKNGLHVVTYVGRFDALIRRVSTGEVGLLEHKTAKAISTRHLALDEQAGSYWAFSRKWLVSKGIIRPDQDLDMILYNFLRKGMPDDRPQNDRGQYLNKDGSISKRQPSPLFIRHPVYRDKHDRTEVLRRIRQQAVEMKQVRDGKMAIYKNPMVNCSYDCQFYDMCELHETGGDWEEYARMNYSRQDPYADYKPVRKKVKA